MATGRALISSRVFRLKHRLRSSLWLVPMACVLVGIGLQFATVAIDRGSDYELIPRTLTGTAASAQSILSTIATSMVTLTTLVLTMTTVAVQLAMGQFSPRIVRALFRARLSQFAFGLFGATFAFAVLALRVVDVPPRGAGRAVPGLTVVVAELLMLSSLVVLILYIHSIGQSLRPSGLIDLVGDELRRQLDIRYPRPAAGAVPGDEDLRKVVMREPGVVVDLDRDGLVAVARDAECVLEMVPAIGDFVPAGATLFRVHGTPAGLKTREVTGLVALGGERMHETDPAYGFRKLVDIAERGLAQPFTDPTTAVQAIDRLHDCLRQLAPRPFPPGRFHDDEGRLRLVVPTLEWEGYVRLAFDEIRLAGAGSPQVPRRLRAALLDLKRVAPLDRQPALDRQLRLLEGAVTRAFDEERDMAVALVPDQQGIGSGPDVIAGDDQRDGHRPIARPRAGTRPAGNVHRRSP